jgi:hypothetical protein
MTNELQEAAFLADGDPNYADMPMPRSFQEAMRRPNADLWREATDKEVAAILKNETYELVSRDELPPTANILGNTWVFKIKTGGLHRARLCVRGDWQIPGVDYFEVFAPTSRLQSFRLILHLAATLGLVLKQVDFVTAFMNGKLQEDVYMRQIPGYEDPSRPHYVCKLKKALNGIRQAPRQWFAELREELTRLGLLQSERDPTIFFQCSSADCVYVVVFVDDLLIAATRQQQADDLTSNLAQKFELKDLGPVSTYLGIEISRNEEGRVLYLSQEKYALKLIRKFGMQSAAPCDTPIVVGHDLTNVSGPQGKPKECDYPQLVGALMYLMVCTRPDLAYAISVLARFMAKGKHTSTHWKAARRVLQYLIRTKEHALVLGGGDSRMLTVYADASYADNKEKRQSTLGYRITLGDGLISWKSKVSATVALSTAEAEYYAAGEAVKEAEWLRSMLSELKWDVPPYRMLMDSQSAMAMIRNNMVSARSKHIELKHHFVRQYYEEKRLVLEEVPSEDNLADCFTKALPAEHLRQQMKGIMEVPPKKGTSP